MSLSPLRNLKSSNRCIWVVLKIHLYSAFTYNKYYEFEVIKSINFDKVFIDVIGFENNYNDVSVPIVKYLQEKNYIVIHVSLDIFMIYKDSLFYKK